jgi:glyoxylase-like metal-dependent hydrolase (beta-lactamase superfamily II)
VEVVASERTKENLTRPDAGVGGVPYIEKQLAAVPGEIAKLKADIQKETDPAKKANLESNLQQAEEFQKELQNMKPALPTRTVATTTTLREGGREIQLHVLGRAHTNGDLFIYLPKEKVVATGDALIDWMPFMADGYPAEWPETLTTLEKLGFDHIIPGHGEVRPKTHLAFFRGYFVDLIAAVQKASAEGATLDEMKTKVGNQLAAKYESGFSKYPLGRYRDRVGTNIEAVYQKVVKKA